MGSFARISLEERLMFLQERAALSSEDLCALRSGGLSDERAVLCGLTENAVGCYALPLGVVPDIVINSKSYVVPLVTEETSVVAALHKTVRWVAKHKGSVCATSPAPQLMIGQIQIPCVQDLQNLKVFLQERGEHLIRMAHEGPARSMAERGGGVRRIELRELLRPDQRTMGVIHLHIDVCDAMGANLITQICAFLKPLIEAETGERVGMTILSNRADQRLVRAEVEIPGVSSELGEALAEASLFAQMDPYRAVTHNKGILNGIDGVAVAVGNDGRAVEAACHAHASRTGEYRGLSQWSFKAGVLRGILEAPIPVGCVGGATRSHPGARLSLKILGARSALELAQVMGAVGLLQNLGALRALVTHSLVRGHMRLHLDNLFWEVGATEAERMVLKAKAYLRLQEKGYISRHDVQELVQRARDATSS